MTNNEAIAMIRNDMKLHHDSLSGKYRKALKMAINALEKRERWIPVTERLPDERGDIVVISTKGGKVREATYALCSDEQAFVTKDCWYCHGEVVAWMPLPEPYKEGQDGQ